jgi:hypothetical protein
MRKKRTRTGYNNLASRLRQQVTTTGENAGPRLPIHSLSTIVYYIIICIYLLVQTNRYKLLYNKQYVLGQRPFPLVNESGLVYFI